MKRLPLAMLVCCLAFSACSLTPHRSSVYQADFSRAVLERCPTWLGVSQLPGLTWSDLGTPRSVVAIANSLPARPLWMRAGRKAADVLASVLHERVTGSGRRP